MCVSVLTVLPAPMHVANHARRAAMAYHVGLGVQLLAAGAASMHQKIVRIVASSGSSGSSGVRPVAPFGSRYRHLYLGER